MISLVETWHKGGEAVSEDYITRGWAKLPAYVKNIEDERDTLRAELAASEARAERHNAQGNRPPRDGD